MKVVIAILVAILAVASGNTLSVAQTSYQLSLAGLPTSYTMDVKIETDTSALVFVEDGYGRAVKNLDIENFVVERPNKRKGRVTRVIPLEQQPVVDLRVVLVIDNSKSMLPRLERVLADMDSLIAQIGGDAEISVVSFSPQPMVLNGQALNVRISPFLRNKEKVRQIYTEIMQRKMTHNTYLYDAVYAASSILREKPTMVRGREVKTFVLLFSDGDDIGSEVTAEKALDQVYTGGSAPVFFTVNYVKKPNSFLRSLASKTGGMYYAAKQDGRLSHILTAVARDTYSQGYRVQFDWRFPPSILITGVPPSVSLHSTSMNEAFPLLAYIFFDESSSVLPNRYHQLSAEQTALFSPAALPPDAMTYYYHVLNIIGSRMLSYPRATITLTGCNAHTGQEINNQQLSQARAQSVAHYLSTVWGIEPERITVEARNLPLVPSRNTDEAARAENRRVEISSDTWEVIRPVTFRKTTFAANDSLHSVRARVEAEDGVRESAWQMVIDTTTLWSVGATPSLTEPELTLSWHDVLSEYLPTLNDTLYLVLRSVSRMGDTATEAVPIVPVVVHESSSAFHNRDKISLILFDFNKADVTPYNARILREFVFPLVHASSSVVVKGYTDDVGSFENNINLAERRAQAVGSSIRTAAPAARLSMHGVGEITPLYSNALPEGRLYNRTVVIYIDTPVDTTSTK